MTNKRGIGSRGWLLGKVPLLGLALSVGILGCGGGKLAPVSGKVTTKGEPVKGGSIMFTPTAGGGSGDESSDAAKTASAQVQADGTYTLSTEKPGDGAKPGKYSVRYGPPPVEMSEEQRTDPKYKAPAPMYVGLVAKPDEVEVKAGDKNTIDIDLVPKGR